VTDRPPALSQDLVDRLKGWVAGEAPAARGAGKRALRMVGRPAQRAVVKLVDPGLQETLDQLRQEAAARQAAPAQTASTDVEVLRAELRTNHEALLEVAGRLDRIERALTDELGSGAVTTGP
jgi:hypothetical protein